MEGSAKGRGEDEPPAHSGVFGGEPGVLPEEAAQRTLRRPSL